MKSRGLRWGIRVLVLLIAAVCLFVLYERVFSGTVRQRVNSPDGRIVAEVRVYAGLSAMDAPEDAVQVKTRLSPFRHTVFFALNYGGSVTLSWKDADTLVVKCGKCSNMRVYTKERSWHDVSIEYAVQ
jgi:hypothetical protein